MEEQEKSRLDRIEDKLDQLAEGGRKKEKPFKLPYKAKLGNSALKKGFITVELIHANKDVDFKKFPIIDGTIKTTTGIHAIDELDIFTYKGKPFTHLPTTKINPWNPLSEYLNTVRKADGIILEKDEIYGQRYVMTRMKSDLISSAKKLGWGAIAFGLVILGVIIYAVVKG